MSASERKTRINAPELPVVNAILAQGEVDPTHLRLAEVAGVSERSVANVVGELAGKQLLRRGRPVRLGSGMGLVVGVSLGSESVRAGLVDANGRIYAKGELEAQPGQLQAAPHEVLRRIRRAVHATLDRAFDEREATLEDGTLALHGVATAWPAPMTRDKYPGRAGLRHAEWRQRNETTGRMLSFPERVASVLGDPFTVEACHALNDVNAQALAIAFDTARKRAPEDESDDQWRVAMVVRVGGGLGMATILLAPHSRRRLSFIDSRLIAGTNGYAGELGHLPIEASVIAAINRENPYPKEELARFDYRRARCSCGRVHHLEAFASGSALARRLKLTDGAAADASDTGLLRAMLDGPLNEVQSHAVRDVGRIIGRALASPILMLDPYSITFTGSVAISELEEGIQLERNVWANGVGDTVKFEPLAATEGAYAGVRGAALAVLRRDVYRRIGMVIAGLARPRISLSRADLQRMRAAERL